MGSSLQKKRTVVLKRSVEPNKTKPTKDAKVSLQQMASSSQNISIQGKMVVNCTSGRLEEHYKVLNKLAQGTSSSVYRVLNLKTGAIRSMTILNKNTINLEDDDRFFLKELEILIKIDHPNFIKIYEYFQDEKYFYVITEYTSGEELYDTISKRKTFDEKNAAYVMRQLLSAVNYLHSYNIVHRNIKPESIIVEKTRQNESKTSEMIFIKLVDFETCNYFDGKTKLTSMVGTPHYIAPDVLRRSYIEKCDIWSCGVILYTLLCGYPPFSGDSTGEIINAVLKGKYTMEGPEWMNVSSTAKDLVNKLLEYNPEKRISAQEAITHQWIKEKNEALMNNVKIDDSVGSKILSNIKSFTAKEKLQQATVAFIENYQLASAENKELEKIYEKLDSGDGKLSYKELKEGYKRLGGVAESDLEKMLEDSDYSHGEYPEYEELLRIMFYRKNIISERNLKLAFEKFVEESKDGKLSGYEIKKVLGGSDNVYLRGVVSKIDGNHVDFEEFFLIIKKTLAEHQNDYVQGRLKFDLINLTGTIIDSTGQDKKMENAVGSSNNKKTTVTNADDNEYNDLEKIIIEFEK